MTASVILAKQDEERGINCFKKYVSSKCFDASVKRDTIKSVRALCT